MEKNFRIISDKQRLHIIFHNLIANAIKYRNPLLKQSTIDIINKSDQDSISFDIRDNGIGIKEENFEKIFEMFFRASDNSSGSGLGLYLVKETIQKLKGNISVSSSAGKGSVFSITLPRLGYDS
jgi:signal transduction histidine kinase